MASKSKKFLYCFIIFLAIFTYFFSYNAKATVRRCALCQCQYYGVEPDEVLKVYTAEKNLCIIEICKKCAHAEDKEDSDSTHSSMDDKKNDNDSTYSGTGNESVCDSTHGAMKVAPGTHNTENFHKNKIVIVKTQIEHIIENIWNCETVVSLFKNVPYGITCRGLTVELITLASFRCFRLTFYDPFYNSDYYSSGPDVIEAILTSSHTQHLMFHSTDNIAIYNNSTIPYFKDRIKTYSKSKIINHTHKNIDKNVSEAIKKIGFYSWHLTTPSHPHNLLDIPLATLLAIRNALEDIVHAPYLAYQLLPYDQQKYIDHVTQHCTKYVKNWLQDFPSYQRKVTDLPDSVTLSESLASNLERCSTRHSFRIKTIDLIPLCTFSLAAQSSNKTPIHDIVFYGNTLLIYQKNAQNIDSNTQTTPWTLYATELPEPTVMESTHRIPSIENVIRSKNCHTMSNDGNFFLYKDLMRPLYYLSIRNNQQYNQCFVPICYDKDRCLAMSNECDSSCYELFFYICVQIDPVNTCIQDHGQDDVYSRYQINIQRIAISKVSRTPTVVFSFIVRPTHLQASFNAYFSSTGNLLFLQSIVPNSLADTDDHLLSVYEKQNNSWNLILDNIPYQPYAQELLKPDDWDNASMIDLSGRCFLINKKLEQPLSSVISGLTLYKKTNNTWTTYSLPYGKQYALRNAQANIQRICFSPDGKKLTLLFHTQKSSSFKYNFCTWLIKKSDILFLSDYVVAYDDNTSYHFILNKKYPTLYNERDKRFFIYTPAAEHINPVHITVIDHYLLECESTPHHTAPIAFSNDKKISITCGHTISESTTPESMLIIHQKSKETADPHTNCFDTLPIKFYIPNMVIHGMKMWTFDRYLVCWGLRITDQEPIVKIFSLTSTVNDSQIKETTQEVTDSEEDGNTSAMNASL